MRRTFALSILSTVVALVASLLVLVPAPVGATVPEAPPPGPHDTLEVTYRHFAVQRPGGKVRERIGIRVGASADVYVGIRDSLGRFVRGRVKLGTLSAGLHYWTWSGFKNGGVPAADGHYAVTVHATFSDSGYTTQDGVAVFVHRRYHPGSVTSTYSTIYPRATTLHDSTSLGNRPPEMVKATMRIRNTRGAVVFTRAYKIFHTFLRVRWDGRDRGGRALPAGTYLVTVSGVDRDGFTGTTKPRAVKVSSRRLVLETRTVTVAPADVVQPVCGFGTGNGCNDFAQCGTLTASDRFPPGALSFRSGTACTQPEPWVPIRRSHDVRLTDNAPRGYGTMTVSMFGGPTTPGAADQGVLSAYDLDTRELVSVSTGPDTGDHTTTLRSVPIAQIRVFDTDFPFKLVPGLTWSFMTRDGASYDVASYTVTYTFLTPRS